MNKFKTVLVKYHTLVKAYPIRAQAIQTGVLMGVGDAVAQLYIEKKKVEEFNVRRFLNFSAMGFIYVGPTLRLWYGKLEKIFPTTGQRIQYKKVLVDQTCFAPGFIGSMLVGFMALNGESVDAMKQKLKQDYKDIMITAYKLWPAVMIINFSFVPVNYQVLVTQTVALAWNTYFAWKANQPILEKEAEVSE